MYLEIAWGYIIKVQSWTCKYILGVSGLRRFVVPPTSRRPPRTNENEKLLGREKKQHNRK